MKKTVLSGQFKTLFFSLFILFAINSCSKKCKNENPRARINNNGTDKADVQIKTSGGNTENINGIDPGTISAWRSYSPGQIEFTVKVQGMPDDTVITVTMASCWEYDILIDGANQVSTRPVERE